MHVGLHLKYPIFLLDFDEIWDILDGVSRNSRILNFVKIRSVETKLFHANGQTDRHKEATTVVFRKFANGPKMNTKLIKLILQVIAH